MNEKSLSGKEKFEIKKSSSEHLITSKIKTSTSAHANLCGKIDPKYDVLLSKKPVVVLKQTQLNFSKYSSKPSSLSSNSNPVLIESSASSSSIKNSASENLFKNENSSPSLKKIINGKENLVPEENNKINNAIIDNKLIKSKSSASTISVDSTISIDDETKSDDVKIIEDEDDEELIEDEKSNHLSSSQISRIFADNLIQIEFSDMKLDNAQFIKILMITETYNSFLHHFYTKKHEDDEYMSKIRFDKFIKAILANKTKEKKKNKENYLIFLIETLIKIALIDEKILPDKKKFFNIKVNELFTQSETLSLSDKCYLLLKVSKEISKAHQISSGDNDSNEGDSNHQKNAATSSSKLNGSSDLVYLLNEDNVSDKSDENIETSLKRANNLVRDLSINELLDLIIRLIDIILIDLNSYKNKLKSIEDENKELHQKLNKFRNEKNDSEMKNNSNDADILIISEKVPENRSNNTNGTKSANSMQAQHLIDIIDKTSQKIKENNLKLKKLQKTCHFGHIYLSDENVVVRFWHFETLEDCLIVEKVFENFESGDAQNSTRSEFYLIDQLSQLNFLHQIFTTHLIDSNLTNGLIKIMEKSNKNFKNTNEISNYFKRATDNNNEVEEKETEERNFFDIKLKNGYIYRPIGSIGDAEEIEVPKIMTYETETVDELANDSFKFLCLLKRNIFFSNLANIEIFTSPSTYSIMSFKLDDALIQFENLERQHRSAGTIPDLQTLIKMVVYFYQILDPKCFWYSFSQKSGDGNLKKVWLKQIESAKSYRYLSFLLDIINENIKWDLSSKKLKCSICNISDSRKAADESGVNLVKKTCNKCEVTYHLNCMLSLNTENQKHDEKANDKSKEVDENAIEEINEIRSKSSEKMFGLVWVCENQRTDFICLKCDDEIRKKMNQQAKEEANKYDETKLNSIELGSRSLRLNKARADKLEENLHDGKKSSKRIKSSRRNLKESDEESVTSVESDYKPKVARKRRGRNYKSDDDFIDDEQTSSNASSQSSNYSSRHIEPIEPLREGLRPRKAVKYDYE